MDTKQCLAKKLLTEIEELEDLKDFIENTTCTYFGRHLGTFECRYKKDRFLIKKKIKVSDDVVLEIVKRLLKEKNVQYSSLTQIKLEKNSKGETE
nr:MAG TPA: hypothetical protein [Caudoviricetes sp.]